MDQLALVTIVFALGALAGFAIGWVAKRDDTQAYLESRERYWQQRLGEALVDRARAEQFEHTAAPAAVVHVHLPAGVTAEMVAGRRNTLAGNLGRASVEAQVVRALPGEVA